MKSVSRWWAHLFPVSEPTKTRLSDGFFVDIVEMYWCRARFWNRISYIYLFLTVLFVIFCIIFFLRGDPQDEQRAAREVELMTERAELRRQLREIGAQEADQSAIFQFVDRANVLAGLLGQFGPTIDSFQRDRNKVQLKKVRAFIALTDAILKHLDPANSEVARDQQDIVIDLSMWRPEDSKRFPIESIAILREEIRTTPIDIESLKAEIAKLKAILAAVESADYAPDSDAMKEAEKVNKDIPAIRQLGNVSTAVKSKQSQAALDLARWQESAPATEKKRQLIQESLDKVEADLKDVREEREKILFMAWVPDLTVRVGAVVLLLFLTQVFVATYRYTVALSAFYLARADAVRLLQPRPGSDSSYSIDDFVALADKLSPSNLSVDDVKGPIEQLTDLAKAWINKK